MLLPPEVCKLVIVFVCTMFLCTKPGLFSRVNSIWKETLFKSITDRSFFNWNWTESFILTYISFKGKETPTFWSRGNTGNKKTSRFLKYFIKVKLLKIHKFSLRCIFKYMLKPINGIHNKAQGLTEWGIWSWNIYTIHNPCKACRRKGVATLVQINHCAVFITVV